MQALLRRLFCDTVDELGLDGVGFHRMDYVLLLLSKVSTLPGIQLLSWIYFTSFSCVVLCSGWWVLALVVILAVHRGGNHLRIYSSLVTSKLSVGELS